jgi:hypothetical protein
MMRAERFQTNRRIEGVRISSLQRSTLQTNVALSEWAQIRWAVAKTCVCGVTTRLLPRGANFLGAMDTESARTFSTSAVVKTGILTSPNAEVSRVEGRGILRESVTRMLGSGGPVGNKLFLDRKRINDTCSFGSRLKSRSGYGCYSEIAIRAASAGACEGAKTELVRALVREAVIKRMLRCIQNTLRLKTVQISGNVC